MSRRRTRTGTWLSFQYILWLTNRLLYPESDVRFYCPDEVHAKKWYPNTFCSEFPIYSVRPSFFPQPIFVPFVFPRLRQFFARDKYKTRYFYTEREERKATIGELFFDLVFVSFVFKLGQYLYVLSLYYLNYSNAIVRISPNFFCFIPLLGNCGTFRPNW
jgi:hypothetical protein